MLRTILLTLLLLFLSQSVSALSLAKRDSTLSLPQCLFDSPSGQVAAIVCTNQFNETLIENACQTGTVPACIWTFDYQGSQVTVCTKNATLVNEELQSSNTSACVCGSMSSFSSGDSTVTIVGAPDSYSSESCTGGFCPLWYSSQPSYTCAAGLPGLGDLSAESVGVIQGGVSSSQSGSALSGSATTTDTSQSTTTSRSGSSSTVTRTATTTSQATSTGSGSTGSSSSEASTAKLATGLITIMVIVSATALYAF